MGAVADRLERAGLMLPEPAAAVGDYVPAVVADRLVFTSGQLPMVHGALVTSGHVGEEVPLEIAQASAQQAALNALAAAFSVCDLDDVERAVRLVCYVASAPGFTDQPVVANAASAVLRVAFGNLGAHVREAVGVSSLPLDAPVEVSLVLALR